tara:strand:+ start:6611 stop:7282 length:672 start_codon:yes stop_codon:yes gene_type:complete
MEKEHIVGKFDKELDRIKNEILEMGMLVKKQIQGATKALLSFETKDVDELITTDLKINGMNKTINQHVEQLIAMRQPMALDLRSALMATSIAAELERLGDHAKSTARRVKKLSENSSGEDILNLLGQMSQIIQEMLTKVLKAYKRVNIKLAGQIRNRDADLDKLYKKIQKESILAIQQNPNDTETLVNFILLARNFERAGDHIVNIARQVHQIVTGEDLKASD